MFPRKHSYRSAKPARRSWQQMDPETYQAQDQDPETLFPDLFKKYHLEKYDFTREFSQFMNTPQEIAATCNPAYTNQAPDKFKCLISYDLMEIPVIVNNLNTYDLIFLLKHFISVLEQIKDEPYEIPSQITPEWIGSLIDRLKKAELFLDPYTREPITKVREDIDLRNQIVNFLQCAKQITNYEKELDRLKESEKLENILELAFKTNKDDSPMSASESAKFVTEQLVQIKKQKNNIRSELAVSIFKFNTIFENAFQFNPDVIERETHNELQETCSLIATNVKKIEELDNRGAVTFDSKKFHAFRKPNTPDDRPNYSAFFSANHFFSNTRNCALSITTDDMNTETKNRRIAIKE